VVITTLCILIEARVKPGSLAVNERDLKLIKKLVARCDRLHRDTHHRPGNEYVGLDTLSL